MTVTQVQLVASAAGGNADPVEPMGRVDLGELAQQSGTADRLGNPQALGGEMVQGLRDLLRRSEEINRIVGQDFLDAQARIRARETGHAIGMPGIGGLVSNGQDSMGPPIAMREPAGAWASAAPLTAASLPGPAERHPGLAPSTDRTTGFDQRWDHLQDTYDRAFVRYTEFAAYQIQASELQKITEQLSNAINTLVRAT